MAALWGSSLTTNPNTVVASPEVELGQAPSDEVADPSIKYLVNRMLAWFRLVATSSNTRQHRFMLQLQYVEGVLLSYLTQCNIHRS